tara:strand:+ start:372 stop:599 length:228 start_codon:yes stop_codon:yes gene_type:complete
MEGLKELRKELKRAMVDIQNQIDSLPSEESMDYDPSMFVIMATKLKVLENVVFIIECKVVRAERESLQAEINGQD